MATQLPVAEGGRASSGGGLGGHWMLIAGIAGIGVVAILLTKGGGGSSSGTTAAGTSINAALGSIQEQNLNLMGQLGASTAALSSQATDYHTSELAAMSGMQGALSDQIKGLDSHLTQVNDGLGAQLGDVNNNVIANGQSITKLGTNLDAYYTSLINAGASNTQAIAQTQAGFWQAAMAALQNLQNTMGVSQSQINQLGNFLGWEFYQIPDRYTAIIPGTLNPPGFPAT